jgi:hypothetical protein
VRLELGERRRGDGEEVQELAAPAREWPSAILAGNGHRGAPDLVAERETLFPGNLRLTSYAAHTSSIDRCHTISSL